MKPKLITRDQARREIEDRLLLRFPCYDVVPEGRPIKTGELAVTPAVLIAVLDELVAEWKRDGRLA